MSKQDDMFKWRMEGLAIAYKTVVEAEGEGSPAAYALRKEIRFRKSSGVNLVNTRTELAKGTEQIKEFTIQTVTAMALVVMWETFGFGYKRLQRIRESMERYGEALVKDEIDWTDILESLEATTGIKLSLPEILLRRDAG